MELLKKLPRRYGRGPGARFQSGSGGFAWALSLALHGAMGVAAMTLPLSSRPAPLESMVMVEVVIEPLPELPSLLPERAPGPEMASPSRRAVRVGAAKRSAPPITAAVPVPREVAVAVEDPTATPVAVENSQAGLPLPAVVAANQPGLGGTAGRKGDGSGRSDLAGLSGGQRRQMMDRYLRELFRNRILTGYPEEARELELAGNLVVQVTVDHGGRLLDLRLLGRCPHPVLCQDALQKLRGAAPFPPPPPNYGNIVRIDVPFNYSIQ